MSLLLVIFKYHSVIIIVVRSDSTLPSYWACIYWQIFCVLDTLLLSLDPQEPYVIDISLLILCGRIPKPESLMELTQVQQASGWQSREFAYQVQRLHWHFPQEYACYQVFLNTLLFFNFLWLLLKSINSCPSSTPYTL